jgi:hypothetical protein
VRLTTGSLSRRFCELRSLSIRRKLHYIQYLQPSIEQLQLRFLVRSFQERIFIHNQGAHTLDATTSGLPNLVIDLK